MEKDGSALLLQLLAIQQEQHGDSLFLALKFHQNHGNCSIK